MILGNNSNGWIGIGIVQEFLSDQVYDITDPLIHAFHGFKFDIGLLVRCVFNGSDSNVVTQRMI